MAANTQEGPGAGAAALRESILWHARARLVRPWPELTPRGKLEAVSLAVRDYLLAISRRAPEEGAAGKRVCILSLEYVLGRSLESHLVNLGLRDLCRQVLAGLDTDLDEVLEAEPEAGLGASSAGEAAAAFLDALAAAGFSGLGYGINYEFGLFKQRIAGGQQVEAPNQWRRHGSPWQVERTDLVYRVGVGGRVEASKDSQGAYRPRWVDYRSVAATTCDMFVSAPGGRAATALRLFSACAADEFAQPLYEEGDYTKAIEEEAAAGLFTRALYLPEDWVSPPRSRLLQEYFLAACALQDILRGTPAGDLERFPDRTAIHLNGAEPAFAIAELMRLLIDEHGLPWDAAWDITTRAISWTNHAETPEMLGKWPVALVEPLLPRHLQIAYEINQRFLREVLRVWPGDHERVRRASMVEEGPEKQLRMAHLAVIGSHAVASAGAEHSPAVQNEQFPDFAMMWPSRFHVSSASVSAARWVGIANPGLAHLVAEVVGEGWLEDPVRLEEFAALAGDSSFRERFLAVKRANKRRLFEYLGSVAGVDDAWLLDAHVKRIHESKRQLLNVLRVVHDFLRIVEDRYLPPEPQVVLFAGKAMPGDYRGKETIRLIHAVAQTIEAHARSRNWLKVVFAPDAGVSVAGKIVAAADLSEQIATAGLEPCASTHIKLAMNGAVTVGALNGAVIELSDHVGQENIYLFGRGAEETSLLRESGVHPREFYSRSPAVRRALDAFLTDELSPGEPGRFAWVYHSLVENWDRLHHLADLESYFEAHARAERDYADRDAWARKAIANAARGAALSSYNAVLEYAAEIWNFPARTRAGGRG